ncbi:hypothetical protein V6N13_105291 [Hibiscus sabdariffa]
MVAISTNMPLAGMQNSKMKSTVFYHICGIYPKGLKWKEHIDVLGDALFSAGLEEWEHERKLVRCLLSHHKFRKAMRRLFGTEFRQGSSLSFNMNQQRKRAWETIDHVFADWLQLPSILSTYVARNRPSVPVR